MPSNRKSFMGDDVYGLGSEGRRKNKVRTKEKEPSLKRLKSKWFILFFITLKISHEGSTIRSAHNSRPLSKDKSEGSGSTLASGKQIRTSYSRVSQTGMLASLRHIGRSLLWGQNAHQWFSQASLWARSFGNQNCILHLPHLYVRLLCDSVPLNDHIFKL